MKKLIFPSLLLLIGAGIFFIVSCDKKGPNSQQAIAGTYKEHSTGTAANPNIGVVMVTGTATLTNPATQNSSMIVGGAGWTNPTCASSGSVVGSTGVTLSGYLQGTSTSVKIFFSNIPPQGTTNYNLSATGFPRMEIYNAVGQPEDITWYSKAGTLTVLTTTANITASFSNVQCLQKTYLFPVVTVSGQLGCN
jgi:hypothetical protein